MIDVTKERGKYLEYFARIEKDFTGNGQSWLHPIRREAMARFSELGFPTPRDEDWKFTNVTPIAQTPFTLAEEGRVELSSRDLVQFLIPGLACSLLVFVNGRYSPALSMLRLVPDGVKVGSLAGALASERDLIEQYLARYADYRHDGFSALNTAFMQDGGFVYLPRGTVLEEPIHLLYVTTGAAEPVMVHPRNLIVMAENSQATIVEHYVSLSDGVYFSNAVTEALVGNNGVLHHYLLERESKQAFVISTLRVQQARSSSVVSHSVLLGGALVRNNVHPVLAGEGGNCLINGLFMPAGDQHMDNFMYVEHASPHCDSRQFYHGILDGRSHGVFSGRIVVHKNAQKTDAKQTNKNVLLSEETQMDSKPQLEIYADDVKCTHGATIGQVKKEAVFYLRSRGIPEESARALMLFGFATESLERMKEEPIRKYLESLVAGWLHHEEFLEDFLLLLSH